MSGRLPDFIIIGAMKCATSTLHEQLALQPGIFMSQPKEPNFFSDDPEYSRGNAWYADLFAGAAEGTLCGESSTHYTKLPTYPHTVERMHELLPEVKLVYVMRHPTERLVSQYIHEWTERVTNAPIDRAVAEHPELVQYSCYAYQLRPYLDTYGSANVLPVFFDELLQEPQRELERICAFLGYPESPHWCDTLEPQNVSSMRLRKNRLRDSIVNSPLPARIRRRYVPQFLRDGLKQLWRMNDRPTISPQVRSELEQRFDEDLGQLGSWMGIELCCANFKQARATRWQRSVNDMNP